MAQPKIRNPMELRVAQTDSNDYAIYWIVYVRYLGVAVGETIPPCHWPEEMRFAYHFVREFQDKHTDEVGYIPNFGFTFKTCQLADQCLQLLQESWSNHAV